MKFKALSRNAELVKFFAEQYDGGVPRTVLVKFIYMADLIAREFLGEPISELSYRLDKHGPYDPAIEDAVTEVIVAELGWETIERYSLPTGAPGQYKRLHVTGRPIPFDFTLGQNEILAYVVKNYVPMPKKELLEEVVYETTPMKAVNQFKDPLPMDMVNNKGRDEVGFELEEVLQAERKARTEPLLTLADFMRGVRTALSP